MHHDGDDVCGRMSSMCKKYKLLLGNHSLEMGQSSSRKGQTSGVQRDAHAHNSVTEHTHFDHDACAW